MYVSALDSMVAVAVRQKRPKNYSLNKDVHTGVWHSSQVKSSLFRQGGPFSPRLVSIAA